MAELEEAVFAILTGDAGVAALAGDRVYPQVIPQDVALPAVAYARISTMRVKRHGGAGVGRRLARARVQVNCEAVGYGVAKALAGAVVGALDGVMATVALDGQGSVEVQGSWIENEGDEYGETGGVYGVRQDFMVWFRAV